MSVEASLLNALPILRERFCIKNDPDGMDLTALEGRIEDFLALQDATGAWPDIRYDSSELKDWHAAGHLKRLLALASAWLDPDCAEHQSGRILATVLRGLQRWFDLDPINPNWWWNHIGAPSLLGEILLRIQPECPPSLIARAVPAFERHRPALRFTGQNLVWVAGVEIRHGVLVRDTSLVSMGFTLIHNTIKVFPDDEGLQPDMSFHQHGRLFYSGGYGQGFAHDAARYLWLAHDTPFAWPPHTYALLARYLLDGSRWMVRGRTFDYSAIGREITRVGHDASRFFTGCSFMARTPGPRQTEFEALLREAGKPGASYVEGNRHFWHADFMVHRRKSFAVSVRLASRRLLTADAPCCGGEGRFCHHGAEGAMFMLLDGDEYRDIFPLWNWRHVPGATVEQHQSALDPDLVRAWGEPSFSGGVSDGRNGCVAMMFSRASASGSKGLSARKAWFFFDSRIIALGCAINSSANVPVHTTINQCLQRSDVLLAGRDSPLPQGETGLTPGATIWHDNIAYHIISGRTFLEIGERTGAWSDCGIGSEQPFTRRVFSLHIDHGSSPANAEYAYAILPGLSSGRFNSATEDLPRILRNDAACQALWHEPMQSLQAVFYESAPLRLPSGFAITPDRPCLLLAEAGGSDGIRFTLADPTQAAGMLTLSISGKINAELAVQLPDYEYAGSSVALRFS